jgi:hypothetical protein
VLFTAAHFEIGIHKLILETTFFKSNAKKPIVFIEEATTGNDPYSQEFIDQVHQIASREKCIVFMMQLCFTLAQKWDTKVLKAIESCYRVLRRLTKSDEYRVFILIQLLIQKMSTEIKQGLGTASSLRSCILKSLKEITVPLIDDQIKKNPYFDKLKKDGCLSHLYLISKLVDVEVEYPILIYQRLFARERKVEFTDLLGHLAANSEAEIHSEFIKIVEFSELYSEYKDIMVTILKFCKVLKKNLNGKLRKGEAEQPISNWIGGGDEKKRKVNFDQGGKSVQSFRRGS